MSRWHVRDLIKKELATLGAIAEFIDTGNTTAKPTQIPWMTVEFYANSTLPECYGGSHMREEGTIELNVFTDAGTGEAAAFQAAEAVADHFKNWVQADIEIEKADPPADFGSGDSEGRYFGVIITFDYVYRYQL